IRGAVGERLRRPVGDELRLLGHVLTTAREGERWGEHHQGKRAASHGDHSVTIVAPSDRSRRVVASVSNSGSSAETTRKKPSSLAASSWRWSNAGWCSSKRPAPVSRPTNPKIAANRTASSNATGRNAGQLASGRPPELIG